MFDIDKARPIIRSCIKRGRSPTETFYALSKKGSDWVEPDDRVEEWLRMLSKGSLKSCSNQPKSDDIDLLVTITEEFQMKKSAIFLFPSDEDDYSFVLLDDRCGVRVQTVDPTKCSLIFIDFFHGKQIDIDVYHKFPPRGTKPSFKLVTIDSTRLFLVVINKLSTEQSSSRYIPFDFSEILYLEFSLNNMACRVLDSKRLDGGCMEIFFDTQNRHNFIVLSERATNHIRFGQTSVQYGSISQSNKIEFRGPSWMIEPDIIWRDMFKFTQDRLYAIKRTQTELVVVAGTIIPMRPRMRIEELFRGSLNQEEDGSERSESRPFWKTDANIYVSKKFRYGRLGSFFLYKIDLLERQLIKLPLKHMGKLIGMHEDEDGILTLCVKTIDNKGIVVHRHATRKLETLANLALFEIRRQLLLHQVNLYKVIEPSLHGKLRPLWDF